MSEDIIKRVMSAKENKQELEQLILDYLPFIKAKMFETTSEDFLTVSMLAFASSIQQYEEGRGNFLAFAALSIRCRILDEIKRENRYFNKIIPIHSDTVEDTDYSPAELEASITQYDKELERKTLSEEIELYSAELQQYAISFSELAKVCPKHKKTRSLCIAVAKYIVEKEELKQMVINFHRLPQTKIADNFNISAKTVEKHRKYIMSVVILLLGDYPHIKTFIPAYREVGNK